MSIKNKIVLKNATVRGYQARGPSSAELRSSVPKHSAERPATTPGVSGESARRGVSANDMKEPIWVNEDEEYCKYLMRFFKGK